MPQLDKLIFFFENIGFLMSFFGLVLYNQYIFYPRLLKNLYVRRFFITRTAINSLIGLFLKNKVAVFFLNAKSIKNVQLFFSNFVKKLNPLFSFYFLIKPLNYVKYMNLFFNKFYWIFISFFFEIYRSYIVEYYPRVFECKFD